MNEATPLVSAGTGSDSLGVLGALRKHWLLALAVMALVLGAATFVTLGMTRIYEARATVLFDPNIPRPLGDQVQAAVASDGTSYLDNKEYYRTQMWVLRSMRVATEVVRKLGLHKDRAFLPPRSGTVEPPSVDEAARWLIERVDVEQIRDSRLVTVSYRDPDPARAQRVLTTLVDTYVQQNLDEVFESATGAADWLRGQLSSLRGELESSEMALHDYKKDKNILSVSLDDQSNMLRGEMQQLSQSLIQVRARRENVAARVAALAKVASDDPENLPALELIESPVLQKLRASYASTDEALSALLEQGKGQNHPEVQSARARRQTTRAALLAEVRNIQGAFQRELESLNREAGGLEALFKQAERRALDLNLLEIEYKRLLRAKENNEKLFSLVVERSKETDLTKMLKVNNIRVVDRPELPKKPARPNVPLNLAGGLVGGLLLGLVAAVGRERLDRTLKTPTDLERELGLPFLGLLPQVAAEGPDAKVPSRRRARAGKGRPRADVAPELMAHEHPASGVAEAARAIRTNILFMSPDKPHKTLLVTSSAPMEGKTTVACMLATTMAQAGQRVVLVDCDLRRPRIHRVFGKGNAWGMTSALLEAGELERAVQETLVPNLWLVTAGPLPPNPAELLQSEAFQRLLSLLAERFDRVIIDSPPLVPVTDGAVLAARVDGTVLVVRAGKTTRELARRGAKALADVGGRIVGAVLNGVDLERGRDGYYQYYYYRREGYGGRSESSAPE